MSEVLWSRYVYLLTGIETITFTSIGLALGTEVHREQAENGGKNKPTEATEQAKKPRRVACQWHTTQWSKRKKLKIAICQWHMMRWSRSKRLRQNIVCRCTGRNAYGHATENQPWSPSFISPPLEHYQ